jgi:hypothetical protein
LTRVTIRRTRGPMAKRFLCRNYQELITYSQVAFFRED